MKKGNIVSFWEKWGLNWITHTLTMKLHTNIYIFIFLRTKLKLRQWNLTLTLTCGSVLPRDIDNATCDLGTWCDPTKPNCTFKPKPIKRPNYKINDEEDSKGPPIRWSKIQWASHILYMGQRDHKDLKKCM